MKKLVVGLIIGLFFLLPVTLANVVVFSDYFTQSTLEGSTLKVERTLQIKNIGTSPIIPGELHFKLYEQKGSKHMPVEVTNLEAYDRYNNQLTTRQIKTADEVDIVVNVWEPLLPNFFHPVYISYEIEFKPKGVFFYQINVPSEETTIPIINNRQLFRIPEKYHVTYAPNATIEENEGYIEISWKNKNNMELEYSIIPFPKMSFKAVNLFWILVILLLLAPIVWLQVKKARGV